ncbi:MAG: winged helix-turn-helix domain-containing protein [Candidatus Korobacteraceae bacterium]
MTVESQSRIFRFGVFEADEATGELRKHGVRLKLHSQPFQLLVMLLERPSELVTRDEMRRRLWDDDTFVDFDHGLNSAVNKLREALSDSAAQPRHIETVAGRGYRFIAAVTIAQPMTGDVSLVQATEDVAARPNILSLALQTVPTAPEAERENPPIRTILVAPDELPIAPRVMVRTLLLLIQGMYLAFYVSALANLDEIRGIFADSQLPWPTLLLALLVASAVVLIPVRLFLFAAVAFDFSQLPEKFRRLFPVLLVVDLLWALSPFLLIHHINIGLALAMTAALVYLPFAQRSLVLMFARGRSRLD